MSLSCLHRTGPVCCLVLRQASSKPPATAAAVAVGALYIDTGQLSALDEIAEAYGHVDAGTRVRILINIARYRDAPQKYQSETGSHRSPSRDPVMVLRDHLASVRCGDGQA